LGSAGAGVVAGGGDGGDVAGGCCGCVVDGGDGGLVGAFSFPVIEKYAAATTIAAATTAAPISIFFPDMQAPPRLLAQKSRSRRTRAAGLGPTLNEG
jgi:hypothetical protein